MKLRTGIDLIEIDRMRTTIQRRGQPFLDRLFTREEQAYCEAFSIDPATRYAGRFAAKEAVAKALGTGIGKEIRWLDLEIRNGPRGEPIAHLTEDAQQRLGVHVELSLSISHCKTHATACAISVCTGGADKEVL